MRKPQKMEKIKSFRPIIDDNSKVLILGSIPGVESLKRREYYGYPRNHFWPIMFNILGESFENDYDKKVNLLRRNKIALWDVINNCQREGSADSNIINEQVNDIVSLLGTYPNIKFIGFNGGKAFESFKKYIGLNILEEKNMSHKKLPSTSPIPGRNIKTIEDKIIEWRIILNYIIEY